MLWLRGESSKLKRRVTFIMKKKKAIVIIFTLSLSLLFPILALAQNQSPQNQKDKSTQNQAENNILVNILVGGVSGVTASVLASAIFWYMLYQQKPKLQISPKIATMSEDRSGNTLYAIKIINKTKTEIINVKLELCAASVVSQTTVDGRSVPAIRLTKIAIGREQPINELMVIDKFNLNDNEAKYAQQLIIAEDINDKCNAENSFLLLRIIATHSASGFSKVYEARYDHPLSNFIVKGRFKGADNLDIIPDS